MAYMHIDNLYRNQDILLFKECFAMEKVHGTSAHISLKDGALRFYEGGVNREHFAKLFDWDALLERFQSLGRPEVTVYGEAYGGSCQGMSRVYGKDLRFIAFDVKMGDLWLSVPNACGVATSLGFEFVDYVRIPTTLEAIDAERDKPSVQAQRNGCGDNHAREGVVLRPPLELTRNNGSRVIAKHKQDAFSERATPQKVVDPEKIQVLTAAEEVAREWVTPMRLAHVLDKIGNPKDMVETPRVIVAMVEDVLREASGEIVDTKDVRRAIGRKAAELFKQAAKETLYA